MRVRSNTLRWALALALIMLSGTVQVPGGGAGSFTLKYLQ